MKLVRRGYERGMRMGGNAGAGYRVLLAQVNLLLGDLAFVLGHADRRSQGNGDY